MEDRLERQEGPRFADYAAHLRVWLRLYQARSSTLPPAFLPWHWPNAWSGPPGAPVPTASMGLTVPMSPAGEPVVRPGAAIVRGVQADNAVPSLLRRACAETLDGLLLFSVKLAILGSLLGPGNLEQVSHFVLMYMKHKLKAIYMEVDEEEEEVELYVEELAGEFMRTFAFILLYISCCVYEVLMTVLTGSTVGKRLMGLRIVSFHHAQEVNGRLIILPATPPGLAIITYRTVLKSCSLVFAPAFVVLLVSPLNRTLYDVLSGTIVVHAN
uniref:protein FAM8A1-like n=1 Tax=Myxine glutinosa TaxID=7769 RepID=UPI00358EC0E8